jgi:hypothetical protein
MYFRGDNWNGVFDKYVTDGVKVINVAVINERWHILGKKVFR